MWKLSSPVVVLVPALLLPPTLLRAQEHQHHHPDWDRILVDFQLEELAREPPVTTPEVYELASIILTLTPYGARRTKPSEYQARVAAHFGRFRDHPLIAKLGIETEAEALQLFDFRENASAYCFGIDGREIVHCKPYSHAWKRVANSFVRNLDHVEDFADRSGFRQFFAENRAYYDSLAENFYREVPVAEMQSWLDRHFAPKNARYQVIFSPLTAGWHSTQQFHSGGQAFFVMFVEPGLDIPPQRGYERARIVFTEIDHNYVNPVSARFAERLNQTFGGDFWMLPHDPSGAYESGERIFNELMTFAVFELWAHQFYGLTANEEITQHLATFMRQRGFRHYDKLAAEARQLYPRLRTGGTFADIYPDLISWAEDHRRSTLADPYARAMQQAEVHVAVRRLAEAERAYQEALRIHPDSAAPLTGLAVVYQQTEQWGEALAVLEELLARDPGNPTALFQTGRAAAIGGRQLERGEEALRRYLALPHTPGLPSHAAAHWRLGMIYERREERDRARREYEAAVGLEPGNATYHASLRNLDP